MEEFVTVVSVLVIVAVGAWIFLGDDADDRNDSDDGWDSDDTEDDL